MNRLRRGHRHAGFTLIELLISLTLLSIVLGALVGTVVHTQRAYADQRERLRAEEALESAEFLLVRVLRSARADPRALGIAGIDPNPLSHATWDNIRVRSDFNPADGTTAGLLEDVQVQAVNDTLFVRWKEGEAAQATAYPIRSVRFDYYQTDGTQVVVGPINAMVTRVKITLTAPKEPGSVTLLTRTTWVYIRN